MQDVLERQLGQSRSEMESRVAFFYAAFLSDLPPEKDMITASSTILFPRERAQLPAPRGKREADARRRDTLLKKDLLRAQLRDIVEAYAGSLRMRDGRVPEALRRKLGARLDKFASETAAKLSEEVQRSLLRGLPLLAAEKNLTAIFEAEAERVNGIVQTCYTQAGWYLALSEGGTRGDRLCRFEAEGTEGVCGRCAAQDGKLYTVEALVEGDLLPPLHPNCRCTLVPAESYGATRSWESPAWYEGYLDNLGRVPSDAWDMAMSYVETQLARLEEGSFQSLLDWLTAGMVSGPWKSGEARARAALENPGWYTIGNLLTFGLFDLAKGALSPEEPLSLEHWLDSVGLAAALYGMAETAKKAAGVREGSAYGSSVLDEDDLRGETKTIKTNKGNQIDMTPYNNHIVSTINPGPTGKPNSSVDILDKDNNKKTRRWFDSDGRAYKDVDMTNHGNPSVHPEWSHEHTWDWSSGKGIRK